MHCCPVKRGALHLALGTERTRISIKRMTIGTILASLRTASARQTSGFRR